MVNLSTSDACRHAWINFKQLKNMDETKEETAFIAKATMLPFSKCLSSWSLLNHASRRVKARSLRKRTDVMPTKMPRLSQCGPP